MSFVVKLGQWYFSIWLGGGGTDQTELNFVFGFVFWLFYERTIILEGNVQFHYVNEMLMDDIDIK